MHQGSLSLVGSGIKFLSHLTMEAKILIESSDMILYLVNEPAMKAWLLSLNKQSLTLETAYLNHELRRDTYEEITQTILNNLKREKHTCIVVEGHPTVFAKPFLPAINMAKEKGFATYILPGISADAYLFADLGLDPGSLGCQSYDATDFLINKRSFDGCSHLILWQISVLGMVNNSQDYDYKNAMNVLVDYLKKSYSLDHEVILYEGSQYPHIASKINKTSLKKLPDASISRLATLYIPPYRKAIFDINMITALNIDLSSLKKKSNA